ncbi:hypothetical protein [Methanosarcina sp. 1.H.A.2.2]|nr:hypothetical protein [Methanosarcina sp. 1.H.A.2.2]
MRGTRRIPERLDLTFLETRGNEPCQNLFLLLARAELHRDGNA